MQFLNTWKHAAYNLLNKYMGSLAEKVPGIYQ